LVYSRLTAGLLVLSIGLQPRPCEPSSAKLPWGLDESPSKKLVAFPSRAAERVSMKAVNGRQVRGDASIVTVQRMLVWEQDAVHVISYGAKTSDIDCLTKYRV
jgi:hypothetical protein